MAIRRRENQYRGVNAHLHSAFQTGGLRVQWTGFHSGHITDISYTLNATLPPGYRAISENSIQIRLVDEFGFEYDQGRRPDIMIVQETSRAGGVGYGKATTGVPTWEATIAETIRRRDEMPAVVIYRQDEETRIAVCRIEVLSPSNKVGSYAAAYEKSRSEALHSGVPLVEIDYLHETKSPVLGMPVYPRDANSYPYNITISDPRLPAEAKAVRNYGFSVNMPIPELDLPLAGEETVSVNFDEIYQRTFIGGAWGSDVDYEEEPERMETYRADDQAQIRAVMTAVQQAHR